MKKTKLKPVNQIVAETIILETKKTLETEIPAVTEWLIPLASRSNYSTTTRGSEEGNLVTPNPKLFSQKNFISKSTKLWNMLPSCAKLIEEDNSDFRTLVSSFCKTLPT